MNDTTEYPQDAAPVKNRKPLKIALAAFGAAVVLTGGTWGGIAYASNQAAAQAHTEAVAFQHAADAAMPRLVDQTAAAADESDTSSADEAVAAEQARESAALAAQQAAADAAAKAAQTHHAAGGHPSGSLVPFIPSSDPNNANGGDYEDPGLYCDSHSASGNPPVCD